MIAKTKLIVIFSLPIFLIGCGGPMALSQITKDKKAHLNQYFSRQAIPQSVLKKVPVEENPKIQTDTKLVFETKSISIASNKTLLENEVHNYSNLGNGLFQLDVEFISNEITTAYNYSLVYKGLFDLKWMFATASRGQTGGYYELKEIKRWDGLGSNQGHVSIVDFKWGPEVAMMNFDDGQYKCTVTKIADAKEIHPKLTGQARYLDCEKAKNGVIFSKSKRAYLIDLGFAIPVETSTANYTFEYKLISVN